MSMLRSLCRAFPRSPPVWACTRRALSSGPPPRTNVFRRVSASRLSTIGLASGALVTTSLLYAAVQSPVHADAEPEKKGHERTPTPLSALVRSYVVYTMCSIPPLVDWSPKLLSIMLSVPGLKQITEAFVRVTFFNQVSLV